MRCSPGQHAGLLRQRWFWWGYRENSRQGFTVCYGFYWRKSLLNIKFCSCLKKHPIHQSIILLSIIVLIEPTGSTYCQFFHQSPFFDGIKNNISLETIDFRGRYILDNDQVNCKLTCFCELFPRKRVRFQSYPVLAFAILSALKGNDSSWSDRQCQNLTNTTWRNHFKNTEIVEDFVNTIRSHFFLMLWLKFGPDSR